MKACSHFLGTVGSAIGASPLNRYGLLENQYEKIKVSPEETKLTANSPQTKLESTLGERHAPLTSFEGTPSISNMASIFLAKWMDMAEVGAGKAVNLSLVTVSGSRMVQRNELPGDLVEGERAEASARTVPIRQLSSRLLPGKLRASAAKVSSLSSGIPSICSLNALQLLCESTRSRPVKRGPTAIDAKEDGDDVAEANADVDADAEGKGDGKDEDEDKDVGGENADVEESEGVEVDSDADDDDGDEENADDADSVNAGEVVKVTSCLASFELSGKQKRWASTLGPHVFSCTAARVTCREVGVGKSSQ